VPVRDYEAWHLKYEDAGSGLSWRLRAVQRHIGAALDELSGPVRVISACAGDGRDLFGVLSQRHDATRVRATLLEIHPAIADRARESVATAGLQDQVDVRTSDAGASDAYLGLVPADLVLLVGIFGNISATDLRRTVAASAQLCAPGARLIWSRGRDAELGDRNDEVRAWFDAAGFVELAYSTLDHDGYPAVGVVRYEGPVSTLLPGQRWFSFER
jgi:hypothetical protein